MPQYLVSGYLPDNFDPSTVSEATVEEIHALCGRSPMANCCSPTARTWKPRSTWAVFGYWKPQVWTRWWRGRARAQKHVVSGSRCERFSSCQPPKRTERYGSSELRSVVFGDPAGNRLSETKKDE
jgi:hypothetical protein